MGAKIEEDSWRRRRSGRQRCYSLTLHESQEEARRLGGEEVEEDGQIEVSFCVAFRRLC
jgi:hypothetical protein